MVLLRLRATRLGMSDAAAVAAELTEQVFPEVDELVRIRLVYDQTIGEEVIELVVYSPFSKLQY